MGPRLEEMLANGKYFRNCVEFFENDLVIAKQNKEDEKIYTYDEAINLTGNGWYNINLLMTLALALQGMALDMFGFTVAVSACSCDLQLDHFQIISLLSVPLLGSIIMAYPWGYISDTRGRKKSLTISLWGSFIIASLSAFSPNWIVLGILKLIASGLSSGVQSMAYTLLGESCSVKTKGPYMIILSSSLMISFGIYTALGYFLLRLEFSYDLGFLIFKPWRLLILSLSITLGVSAILISFFYESPKFLINYERTEQALGILRKIKQRNGLDDIYPVQNLVLPEATTFRRDDLPMISSLWKQLVPLFKPPLLKHTSLLFYLTSVIYSSGNGFFSWLPIIINSFFENSSTLGKNETEGFCELINSSHRNIIADDCTSTVNIGTLLTGIGQGLVFTTMNLAMSRVSHRKKTVLIILLTFCAGCCLSMLLVKEKISTIVVFLGFMLNSLGMGIVFSYFVELFPTSHRGTISCLGVMVARISGLSGVNLVGAFIFSNCSISLFTWGAYTLTGALVSLLLPPDSPNSS